MFRTWLFSSLVVGGIAFIVLGIYYRKTDPNSWVRSSTTWIEFPEWFTHMYTGVFFIVLATIIVWFTS
jgi:hypothetical protein